MNPLYYNAPMFAKRCALSLVGFILSSVAWTDLWIHGIPTGFGEAYAIQCRDQDQIWTALVDAGQPEHAKSLERYLKQHHLLPVHAGFLTHPHANHLGGFQRLAQRRRLNAFFWSGGEQGSDPPFPQLLQVLQEQRVAMYRVRRGDQLRPAPRLSVTIVHPETLGSDPHENGLVLLVRYGDTAFLFSGDLAMTKQAEVGKLLAQLNLPRAPLINWPERHDLFGSLGVPRIQGVTWPHHGDLLDESWLGLLSQADVILLGVGPNPWQLPRMDQLKRPLPGRILRTDAGPTRLRSDGVRIWVEAP